MSDIENLINFVKPEGIKALESYKERIIQDAYSFDVIKDKNIENHLQLLVESINRAIFNLKNPNPKDKEKEKTDLNLKTRKWLGYFRDGFKRITGTDPLQKPNATNIKTIQHAICTLMEKGASVEDYIKWLFEDFYPSNENFMPPNLGFTASAFALERFLVAYQEILEKKKSDSIKQTELTDILNRYRVVMRENNSNNEVMKSMVDIFNDYKKGKIELKEFKEFVIKLENLKTTKDTI